MITKRKSIELLKAIFWRGLAYSAGFCALVWTIVFCVSLFRYHILGHTPDGILWLAPQHMPWSEALKKSAYLASVSAIVMMWFGIAVTIIMNCTWLIIIGLFLLLPKRTTTR